MPNENITSDVSLLKQREVDLSPLWEGREPFPANEVTVKVVRQKDGEQTEHILQCFIIDVGEQDSSLPTITMMTQGGGGSDAYSSAFMAKDVATAFTDLPRDYNVKLVHLPHVIGSVRTDQMKQNAMATSGEVLYEALSGLPSVFGSLDRVVLEGISAGGGELTELARHLGNDGKLEALVLGDPAGIHENPALLKNFVLDPLRSFSDHYKVALTHIQTEPQLLDQETSRKAQVRAKFMEAKNKLQAVQAGVRETVAEILAGMCTPEGKPKSIVDMAKKQLGGAQIKHINSIAAEFDLPTEKSGIAIPDMLKDSTEEARAEITAPVVFAPMIGARVVNALWDGLSPQIRAYDDTYSLQDFRELLTGQKDPESMDFIDAGVGNLVKDKLRQLFPNAPVYFVPIDANSHGRAFSESAAFQTKMVHVVDTIVRSTTTPDKETVTAIL
jgi:hypothetical protein